MTELVVDPSVTTGPIVGSRKYNRDLDGVAGARVPFRRRRVRLSLPRVY
jgi:phosphomethylpyrimidine synthase